ncbi:MAG: hypothetical protein LBI18_06175 [Planctomycetaceae bacterium]|jgi:hypothetical protein|nr:hypothetical protein [Planctomycetaceae bacterium]
MSKSGATPTHCGKYRLETTGIIRKTVKLDLFLQKFRAVCGLTCQFGACSELGRIKLAKFSKLFSKLLNR